jgi:predicted nucleic acid-binding protein
MMDQFILFADTNVFLDAFLKRDAGKDCKEIFMMAENSQVEIFTSPTCLMTMIYFLQKAGMPIKAVKEIVEALLKLVSIISPDKKTFETALKMNFSDIEDTIPDGTSNKRDRFFYNF